MKKYIPHISSTLGLVAIGLASYFAYKNHQLNMQVISLNADLQKAKAAAATTAAPKV